MSENLEISREGRVLRLTLNRIQKKNAINVELCSAIADAVEGAGKDPSVGAVLIDAKGDVFCAGMDLDEVLAPDATERTGATHERIFTMGAWARKPLIGAVNGPALGGGVGLIANLHIVFAAQGCSFGLTEIRIGMWPYFIWRSVVRAIGERRATALALTGRIFSANEALQYGLVHEITPTFELDDRATATAMHVAELSTQSIAAGLEFTDANRQADPETARTLAARYRRDAFASDAFREGVTAFRQKRKPLWTR